MLKMLQSFVSVKSFMWLLFGVTVYLFIYGYFLRMHLEIPLVLSNYAYKSSGSEKVHLFGYISKLFAGIETNFMIYMENHFQIFSNEYIEGYLHCPFIYDLILLCVYYFYNAC